MSDALKTAKVEFCLRQGDSCLILGQRLSEWCGHGPALELDIALSNLGLDLIGQARMFLQYAGELEGKGRDEDALAYMRDASDYRNFLMVEQPNGDFGQTILRQHLFSSYQRRLYENLSSSVDERLAAIAQKALKETRYHERFSRDWVIRLGDGTQESNKRMQRALNSLWRFSDELFEQDEVEETLIMNGVLQDMPPQDQLWRDEVETVLGLAKLTPPVLKRGVFGGRYGVHTEHLGHILGELQFLQRAYPGAAW